MLEELLVEEARYRAKIFENLPKYLRIIVDVVKELDEEAEVYLFGSVAENRHTLSSDIDVLVLTSRSPGEVLAKLWERGIKDPFEIHVVNKKMFEMYRRRAKLVKLC